MEVLKTNVQGGTMGKMGNARLATAEQAKAGVSPPRRASRREPGFGLADVARRDAGPAFRAAPATGRRRCFRAAGRASLIPLWLAIRLLFSTGLQLSAQDAPTPEYKVKAAFLFNFAQFVEWPPETFPERTTPLVIGVLGDDPFKGFLGELVRDEKAGDRPLLFQHHTSVEAVTNCHILFISSSESTRVNEILARLKNRSVLTVGEADGFLTGGGMVRFVMEKNKVRFRINATAAREAKLTISSKVLRLAAQTAAGGKE